MAVASAQTGLIGNENRHNETGQVTSLPAREQLGRNYVENDV